MEEEKNNFKTINFSIAEIVSLILDYLDTDVDDFLENKEWSLGYKPTTGKFQFSYWDKKGVEDEK